MARRCRHEKYFEVQSLNWRIVLVLQVVIFVLYSYLRELEPKVAKMFGDGGDGALRRPRRVKRGATLSGESHIVCIRSARFTGGDLAARGHYRL